MSDYPHFDELHAVLAQSDRSYRLTRSGSRLAVGDWGLHCGEALEVRIAGQWVRGRVEFSQGGDYLGWYLCGNDGGWFPLVAGMVARRP